MPAMEDDHQPREHDHLVEPMYKALHDRGQGDPGDVPAADSRRDRVALWLLPLLGLAAWGMLRLLG